MFSLPQYRVEPDVEVPSAVEGLVLVALIASVRVEANSIDPWVIIG